MLRWRPGLLNLVDDAWLSETLPDEDVELPKGLLRRSSALSLGRTARNAGDAVYPQYYLG